MAGLVPAIATRMELAKGAIPVSNHPMEMAGSSPGSSPAMSITAGSNTTMNPWSNTSAARA